MCALLQVIVSELSIHSFHLLHTCSSVVVESNLSGPCDSDWSSSHIVKQMA